MKSKRIYFWFLTCISLAALTSCEDVIDLQIQESESILVVDGWITNQPETQTIRLSKSAPYFANTPAQAVLGAEVTVTDNLGNSYQFRDNTNTGNYTWNDSIMGHVGRKYTLSIKTTEGHVYTAVNEINRVPPIDSIVYQEERLPFKPDNGRQEGYRAQFYARDFAGLNDTYWIKPIIRGKAVVAKATDITIAWDASSTPAGQVDGLIFILPLRQSITVDSLFLAGETVGVELHSISNEAYAYLKQVRDQSLNGGLLAIPMSNIRSNVTGGANTPKVLGYFGASAVSRLETSIDASKARPKD